MGGNDMDMAANSAELREDALLLAETVFLLNQNSRRLAEERDSPTAAGGEGMGDAMETERERGRAGASAADDSGGKDVMTAKTSSISALLN